MSTGTGHASNQNSRAPEEVWPRQTPFPPDTSATSKYCYTSSTHTPYCKRNINADVPATGAAMLSRVGELPPSPDNLHHKYSNSSLFETSVLNGLTSNSNRCVPRSSICAPPAYQVRNLASMPQTFYLPNLGHSQLNEPVIVPMNSHFYDHHSNEKTMPQHAVYEYGVPLSTSHASSCDTDSEFAESRLTINSMEALIGTDVNRSHAPCTRLGPSYHNSSECGPSSPYHSSSPRLECFIKSTRPEQTSNLSGLEREAWDPSVHTSTVLKQSCSNLSNYYSLLSSTAFNGHPGMYNASALIGDPDNLIFEHVNVRSPTLARITPTTSRSQETAFGNTYCDRLGRIIETDGVYQFLEESRFCTRVNCLVSYLSSDHQTVHHPGIRISGTIFWNSNNRGAVIALLHGEREYRVFESSQVVDTIPKAAHHSYFKPYSVMKTLTAQKLNRSACGKCPNKRAKAFHNHQLLGSSHQVDVPDERDPPVSSNSNQPHIRDIGQHCAPQNYSFSVPTVPICPSVQEPSNADHQPYKIQVSGISQKHLIAGSCSCKDCINANRSRLDKKPYCKEEACTTIPNRKKHNNGFCCRHGPKKKCPISDCKNTSQRGYGLCRKHYHLQLVQKSKQA